MKTIMLLSIIAGLLLAATASADTIYKWTDEQGVQRFSNSPPPEGIENFQKIEAPPSPPPTQGATEARRSSYDHMVQQATEEARRLESQRKAAEAARAAEQKRLAEEQRKEKIQAQRRLLEQKIESINQRALSPTFTQGMKRAQIDQIQKQIEAIEKNPDTGVNKQQEAASESKSGY